jgi:endonuclease-3 related protein
MSDLASSPAASGPGPDEVALLLDAHDRLARHYDLDRWHWREDTTALDICLGAILVQHTAWGNVEKALANLKAAAVDSIEAVARLDEAELALLVRPAGTPLTKARRLQAFGSLVLRSGGFEGLFALPHGQLRDVLLATPGIGPETADVIILYGARLPAIVHDAYTARLLRRLGTGPPRDSYRDWQSWLHERLPAEAAFRRAHHAAIVVHCKQTCRSRPRCWECPLAVICEHGRRAGSD